MVTSPNRSLISLVCIGSDDDWIWALTALAAIDMFRYLFLVHGSILDRASQVGILLATKHLVLCPWKSI